MKSKGAEKPAAKGRKGKAGKDPNKPKRAPSAFFVFMSDHFPDFLLPSFFFFGGDFRLILFRSGRSSVRSSRRRTPRINLSLL